MLLRRLPPHGRRASPAELSCDTFRTEIHSAAWVSVGLFLEGAAAWKIAPGPFGIFPGIKASASESLLGAVFNRGMFRHADQTPSWVTQELAQSILAEAETGSEHIVVLWGPEQQRKVFPVKDMSAQFGTAAILLQSAVLGPLSPLQRFGWKSETDGWIHHTASLKEILDYPTNTSIFNSRGRAWQAFNPHWWSDLLRVHRGRALPSDSGGWTLYGHDSNNEGNISIEAARNNPWHAGAGIVPQHDQFWEAVDWFKAQWGGHLCD